MSGAALSSPPTLGVSCAAREGRTTLPGPAVSLLAHILEIVEC